MAENFIIELIAALKKGASKKQIQEDAKNLGDIKVPLVGTLNKARTKAQLKQDLSSMNGDVNLTGKFNSKGVTASVKQATAQAQKQANAAPVQMSFAVKKENLINDIKLLAQQNSRLFKNTDMTAKYNFLLDSAKLASTESQVSNLRMQLNKFNVELKETKYSGMTLIDVLKNGLSKVLLLFGNHGIIKQFTAQLRNAWKEAQELDASITSLSKVCDELADRSSFPAYIDKSISKAKELCTDVNDLLYAVTEFKKLGNTLENSEILAEYAIRLQNVGDTNIDTAISSIKTAMATFDEIGGYTDNEYENKVEAYIDLINNLTNRFSIDAESLANAVRISAGTLVEANTSIEELASIITASNKFYDDPSYLANTIKIGALRLRASKTSNEAKELAELGENIDDLAESTSNLREEMMALTGVDIMIDDKNFKSYYQQLLDISKVYQSLDETTQANVLEKMFGKNRSAAGANILKAMADSVEVYNEALQSAGSSQEEFSRWTESAEAATKRFGVAMTETYNNIISGDTVKGLSNVGAALLDLVNKLGLVEKGFKGFLIIGAMKGITTLSVALKNSAVQLSNYGSALEAVKKVSTCAQDTREYADAMKALKSSCANLTDAQLKQVLANRKLDDSQLKEILQLDGLKKKQREARLAQLGLIKTTKEQTTVNGKASASTFSLKASMKGLKTSIMEAWAAMSALQKASIIFAAISTVWSFISLAMDANNQKAEEARQKAAELTEAYKQQQSSLDSQIKKYKELKESLDKGNLSIDEARSIKEQLLEIQNSLIDTYGTEASNIDLLNGKYREQLGLLNDLSKEKARDYVTEHESDYQTAKKELEKVRKYNLGNIEGGGTDTDKLKKYIKTYSELFDVKRSAPGETLVYIKANAEEADQLMHQFSKDLDDWADQNDINRKIIEPLQIGISKYAGKTMTDALKEHKTVYDEYMKAKILSDDTLRPLYQQSIQAVEAYNKSLSSGEGVEGARANLDSLQQSVQDVIGKLDKTTYGDLVEGFQKVFGGIYEAINKNAEAAYQLNQAFENDETVKRYAEQLRGLLDIDLKAINFKDNIESPGEKAFGALIDILGLSEDEVQKLIDKLVELGYVQGQVQEAPPKEPDTFDITTYKDQIDDFQSSISTLRSALNSLNSGSLDDSTVIDLMQEFPELAPYIDLTADGFGNLAEGLKTLIEQRPESLIKDLESLKDNLVTDEEREQVDLLIGALQRLSNTEVEVMSLEDSLDKFQSSVKSAADAYATLLTGNYSSSELLDSIQAINKAASDMGKAIDWEAIAASDNPLKAIQDEIESISNTYADSVLSGAGIDVDSDFGQMLANIVQEAYKSEAALKSLNGQIDSLQSAYNDLTDIVDSYNKTGYITFDQLQTLLAMEPQYLSCLIDENGQLSLNQEAMTKLANQRLSDARAQIIEQTITELGELQFKKEKTAIEGVTMALEDSDDTITSYEERLLDFIPIAELTTEEFIKLSNAINGAVSNGVSDEDIDEVIKNAEKKLKLVGDMWNGTLKNMLGGSSSEKDTTKEFDWIEQAIKNVEKEAKALDDVVNSSYSTFSQKNAALAKEISKVSEEIALQQKAYEEYMRKADSIGLSDEYKHLIRDVAINIENITDEDLQKKISDYQQWYEKAVDVSEAISDLNEQMKDLHVKGYELQAEKLEDLLDSNTITEKQYLAEMKKLYKEYYENQVEYAQKAHEAKMALLEKEKSYLNSVANAASSLLDKEISKVQDNAKAQEEPYKVQIKEAEKQKKIYQDQIKAENKKIDAYNKEIDLINDKKKPLQDELDALEDKVRKEELALNLQKAQYDLAKAQNQKTKLVYYMPDAIVI